MWKTQRQIEAMAVYSDGSMHLITTAMQSWTSSNPEIAPISSTGVVTGVKPGNFRVTATYSGLEARFEAAWDLHVFQDPYRPPEPNEVTGRVRQVTAVGSIDLRFVDVEVVGGASDGRKLETNVGGLFRVDGLQAPGFDLIFRRRGYANARVHVPELGRELRINLAVAPGVLSDLLEGDVCWPKRTITRTFTPTEPGFLRITGQSDNYTTNALYADGVVLQTPVYQNQDVELRAGVTYELRVTGTCSESPSTRVRITLLRPVD